jgi:hypothetical protein
LPIFLWQTYSRINLRCRFLPLLAWLSAPLSLVLDSLPKCAPRTRLTLLQKGSIGVTMKQQSNFVRKKNTNITCTRQ